MLSSPLRSPLRSPLGAAVLGGFTPLDLGSKLLAWWDMTDRTQLFADTAMTTPITGAGATVAALRDKGTAGLHISQSTAGARPLWRADGTLYFDGTDDSLTVESTAGLANGTTIGDMCFVGRNDSPDTSARMAFSYGGGSAATRRSMQVANDGAGRVRTSVIIGNNTTSVTLASATGDWDDGYAHSFYATVQASAVSSEIDDNGTIDTANVVVNTLTTRTRIGMSTGASNFWLGPLRHVLVLSSTMTTADRAVVQAWANTQRSGFAP